MENKTCFGCKHMTSVFLGDGGKSYGCKLFPGLVTGCLEPMGYKDEPKACENYAGKLWVESIKRGFASMSLEKRTEAARKGGRNAHEKGGAHEWNSEEATAAGRIGGRNSHGGGRRKQIDKLLPPDYEEYGSIVGTMEMITVHEKRIFNIYDELTGNRVECRFRADYLDQTKVALARRVEITGRIHYSGDNMPKTVTVDTIRVIPPQGELPQASDLEGINITDGEDPVDYVRRIRDAF